jgi:urate oxidase
MPHPLTHHAYGKHRVRVSKIKRPRPRDQDPEATDLHQFIEAAVDVTLEGDLETAYTEGDNTNLVATDTVRNTVYVLAKDDDFASIESFGVTVAEHFLTQYDHLNQATVELAEHQWHALVDHAHCFNGSNHETPTARVVAQRGEPIQVSAGLDHLMIAKTTETGFEDFHRDEFRTLPDTADRVFATVLTAEWDFTAASAMDASAFIAARQSIRDAMLKKFTDHYSRSVQETLYLMANAGLDADESTARITLQMPNKHHLKFNLEPFGRENNNEVFHVTDEPYGYIRGTVERAGN